MSSSGGQQQRSHRSAGATLRNGSSSTTRKPRDGSDRDRREGAGAGAAMPIPVSGRPSKAETLRTSSGRTTTEKEAKVLSQELAALLTKKDPWHQDVIFARENLRRHCLALIFRAPADAAASATSSSVASQSKQRLSALSALFLSTSHAVIHHFRQRLSAMDKGMAQAASERALSRRDDGSGSTPRKLDSPRSGPAGPAPTSAQRRRLLHSFRDFLAKEETFWRDLLIRIVGVFDVEEARTPLRLLQLGVGDWEPDPRLSSNKEIHEQAILLCHRTLICMGDLARYKELYAENKNQNLPRPRGGKLAPRPDANDKEKSWSRAYEAYHQARLLVPDDGNPSNQLAVLAGYEHDSLSTVYHYYRALCVKKAFTTARQNLAPTFAKILTSWESDEKAKADKKKLQARNGSYADVDGDDGTPGSRAKMEKMDAAELVDEFQKAFVILHAILFQGTNMEQLPQQFTKVTQMFSICVSRRILPSDIVVKVIVTALSAWWYARMDRRSGDAGDRAAAVDPAALESSALMHALAMLSELMVIANAETREVELAEALQTPPTAPPSEWGMLLAQSITAVLRRALPALRIASMWLLSNADYFARYDSTAATFKPATASEGGVSSADPAAPPPEVCMAIRGFWNTYMRCVNSLSRTFPADLLSPVASASGELMLEEDIDMLGFMPLRRRMKEASIGKAAKEVSGALASAAAASSTLHPNEEQVLRIGDLLSDAKLLAQSESCPVIVQNSVFTIRSKRLNPASQSWNPKASPIPLARVISPLSGDEDSAAESQEGSVDEGNYDDELDDLNLPKEVDELSSTVGSYEEDLLDLAMRVTTGNESLGPAAQSDLFGHGALNDEEDDDEVLYPTRPTQASYTNATTNTPSPPAQYAKASAPVAGLSSAAAGAPTRTASDLLLQVLQGNSLDLRSSPLLPNVPGKAVDGGYASAGGLSSSPFLQTGSTSALGALPSNRSIWSTASTGSEGFSAMPGASASGLASAGSSPGMQNRMRPGNAPFPSTGNTVAGSSGNAEALFNSMPNQNQQAAPPGLGSGIAPGVGRPVAAPVPQFRDQRSAQTPAAAATPFSVGDIWGPVGPSAHAFPSPGQRAAAAQSGQPANPAYQTQQYTQRAAPAMSSHAPAQQQQQAFQQYGRQYG